MGTSTFSGPLRAGPKGTASAGTVKLTLTIAFDPTQASAASGFILPKGAMITGVTSLGGATGGTNPTVDIGISGATDSIANEVDADTAGVAATLGANGFVELAADTPIWVGVGASAATGGTTSVLIEYIQVDSKLGVNT